MSSHGKYRLPNDFTIIRGNDAEKFLFFSNGVKFPHTEAVVLNPGFDEQLIFSFFKTGHVRDDDWSDLDKDLLLEGITESTEEANGKRIKNGIEPLHIIGWAQEPTYDKLLRVAYWAIKATEGGGMITINAVALKLGRRGHSELRWVGPSDKFDPSKGWLIEATNNYQFDKGHRYADFSTGDTIAAVGIASLVAATAGSKGGKGVAAGLLAALLLFAKKLWWVVIAAIAAVFAGIKRLFRRGEGG